MATVAYFREIAGLFSEASEQLETAATRYDRELDSLKPLFDICAEAHEEKAFTDDARDRARRLIAGALEADREAILFAFMVRNHKFRLILRIN